MATQTDRGEVFKILMDQANKDWQNCLSTTTRLKFEQLREKYYLEVQGLLQEIRKEREFRTV